jgi:hypothetical protein
MQAGRWALALGIPEALGVLRRLYLGRELSALGLSLGLITPSWRSTLDSVTPALLHGGSRHSDLRCGWVLVVTCLATLAADGSHAADDVEYVRLRNTPHLLQKPQADAQLIWHERREQGSERAGERLSERASEQEGAVFTDQYGRSSGRETARRQERTRALTRPAVSSLQPIRPTTRVGARACKIRCAQRQY